MLQLEKYQLRGIGFGFRHPTHYQMVDMGLGKTVMALHMIQRANIPTIVWAPKLVCYHTWPKEIRKWTPNLSFTILHGKNKDKNLKLKRHVYLINYDGIKWFYKNCLSQAFPLRKYFFVWDESSFLKNASTLRFKLMKKMVPMMSQYRLPLSGTPSPQGLHDLWAQYYLLDKGKRLMPYYSHFRDTYFHYTGPPAYKTYPKFGTKEKIFKKIEDITYRLSEADHLNLPPLIVRDVKIDLPPSLRRKYDTFEKDSVLELDGLTLAAFSEGALSNKCRQFLQGAVYTGEKTAGWCNPYRVLHDIKLQMLKEICEALAGQQVLAAIQYKFEILEARKVFRYEVPYIAGGMSGQQSVRTLDAWNAGDIPLLLCHPAAIGHGLNLQESGSVLVWLALPWSLEQYLQLIKRLHRRGQKRAVTVLRLMFESTVDQAVAGSLGAKNASQQQLFRAIKEAMKWRRYAR